jgi:hypothetical protein
MFEEQPVSKKKKLTKIDYIMGGFIFLLISTIITMIFLPDDSDNLNLPKMTIVVDHKEKKIYIESDDYEIIIK